MLSILLQALCDPACETPGNELENPDYCAAHVYGAGPALLFVRRCAVWVDVTDPQEWIAKITAGDIKITPCGNFTKEADTTASNTTIEQCKEFSTTFVKAKNLNFTSNSVAADGVSHYKYIKALECAPDKWDVIPVTCCISKDGEDKLIYHLADNHINAIDATEPLPTSSPGHRFSWTLPPFVNPGDPNTQKSMTFNLSIPRSGEFNATELPGVTEAVRTVLAL